LISGVGFQPAQERELHLTHPLTHSPLPSGGIPVSDISHHILDVLSIISI
jgi:hypothetical protein